MNYKSLKRLLIILTVIFWIFAIGIYAIANQQFHYVAVQGKTPQMEYAIGEITDEIVVSQIVTVPSDFLASIDILAGNFGRTNTGTIWVTFEDSAGNLVAQMEIDASTVNNGVYTTYSFEEWITTVSGEQLVMRLTTEGCQPGNAITIYAGRINPADQFENYIFGENRSGGSLCVRLNGYNTIHFYQVYWIVVISTFAVLFLLCFFAYNGIRQGKSNFLAKLFFVFDRYSFLMKQLVIRDFKQKYKRSKLGMAWSVMNPLLTMTVQYVVFSTLFKSGIPNYPVYLLTGIVFFSFFNESVNSAMLSIIGNASLIKKVYMPKYIYPISRVITSLVNFALALIPLALITIITKLPVRAAMLLLIFDILCFLMFIVGISLLLSTIVTFFQDVLHLWGVLCMIWQYLTPIFYPESIIPERFLPLYRLNPLYQFITFARTCIIDGISPTPQAYFLCILYAVGMLGLGAAVFKKYQNEFVFRI